jgi:diadenosine tetraphosphate (Ap4A) HIT family hydrolase
MEGCLACDLYAGRTPLPGGVIHETRHWAVEHCVGPLGLGTLVVKPKRHVEHVADLSRDEADELGPLLRLAARAATEVTSPDQVYVTLWSHAAGAPVHVHWVVQPVSSALVEEFGTRGPALQAAMFARGEALDRAAVEDFAERARAAYAAV